MSAPNTFEPLAPAPAPVDSEAVVALRADLAAWLRDYAERAERGELVAVAIATVRVDHSTSSAWHDESGHGVVLLGSIHCLAQRVVFRLTEGAE